MDNFEMETEYFRNAIKYVADEANGWGGQTALSQMYGCSNSYINMIISGAKKPSYKVQQKFAKILHLTRDELLAIGKKRIAGELPKFQFNRPAPHISVKTPPIDFQDEVDRKHQIVISGFENKELALEVNQILIELEKRDPSKLLVVRDILNGLLAGTPVAEEKKGPLNGTEDVK